MTKSVDIQRQTHFNYYYFFLFVVHALEDEIDIDDDDDDEDAGVINQHLIIERKASVSSLLWIGLQYAIQAFTKKVPRHERQWSRSFAPQYLNNTAVSKTKTISFHYNNMYSYGKLTLFYLCR